MALPSFRNLILGVATVLVTDWDDAPSGIFYTTNSTAHTPTVATLTGLCYKNASGHTIQIALRASNGEIYYRTRAGQTAAFSAWYKINVTIQS